MTSVAIIVDNLGPYHIARLQAAAEVFNVLVVEVAGTSSTYAWTSDRAAKKFQRATLLQNGTGAGATGVEIGRRLDLVLAPFRPDVVAVPGWASPAAWSAIDWCAGKGVPMICLSESTAWDEPPAFWKPLLKRRLLRFFSSALVGGRHHRTNLIKLGMRDAHIFSGYDAVDNDYFFAQAKIWRDDPTPLRRTQALPDAYFLTSARFVEKKNLAGLLEAYAGYRSACKTTPWSLVMLGDGPLRGDLERQIGALGLGDCVHLPGFRQYEELPIYYARAGAFILPSTVEPWGLVVNEAAASGLPLLVSNRCGCAPELVEEGANGFTFDPLDVQALAAKMTQIAAPDFPRADFGAKSFQIVKGWGLVRFVEGLEQAIGAALEAGPFQPNAVTRVLLWLLNRR